MQMNDSQRFPASKQKVWDALNNPEVLSQCTPGCQSLEMSASNEMTATVVLKVGPVLCLRISIAGPCLSSGSEGGCVANGLISSVRTRTSGHPRSRAYSVGKTNGRILGAVIAI